MAVLGYTGSTSKLWVHLPWYEACSALLPAPGRAWPQEKAVCEAHSYLCLFLQYIDTWLVAARACCMSENSAVRFKDLCPEVIEEIREFKNLAGKKIITLIQVGMTRFHTA